MSFLTEEALFSVKCLALAERFLIRLIRVMFPLFLLLCFYQLRIVKFQMTRFVPRCTMGCKTVSTHHSQNIVQLEGHQCPGTVRHLLEMKCTTPRMKRNTFIFSKYPLYQESLVV